MRIRPPLALLAVAAVVAGFVGPVSPASADEPLQGPNGFTPSAVVWKSCAKQLGKGFQCGTVAVPLNWDEPEGRTITIAVSRLVHQSDDYQGVMLVNPGGPGGSGLGLPSIRSEVPNGGGRGYDWIGFDPRGVGASSPSISCITDYTQGVRPPYEPTTKKIEHAWLKRTKAYAAACAAKYPHLLKHMTTADAAKDMDTIRAALGQQQINYYGFSYGTYLGQVYGTLFPDHLRRVVFDGTVDPRGVWYGDNLDQDRAFEVTENIFFGWVAKHDRAYHLGTTAKAVSDRYYSVKASFTKHPVGKVGPSEWADMLLPAGYYQSYWPAIASVFSAWAVHHDKKALAALYEALVDAPDNGFAVYSAVQCSEAPWPSTYAEYKAQNEQVAKDAPFYTWGNAWFNAPCLYWPVKRTQAFAVDGSQVQSVLMISETLDAATPYPGSIEVRNRFPGARLIAEPGGTTHAGSLSGNACVDDRIAAYLKDGALPDRQGGDTADVTCAPLPQPKPTKGVFGSSAGSARAGLLRAFG